MGRNGKAQDSIKAKDCFSNIARLGSYLVDFDVKLDLRVPTAPCLLVAGIALFSLTLMSWNKDKKRLCLVVKEVKSSLIKK